MRMRTTRLMAVLPATALPALAAKPPDVQWTRLYDESSAAAGYYVTQTQDGGYIACGVTYPDTGDYGVCYIVKTNSRGKAIWQRIDDWASESDGRSIAETKDGGYIVTGAASPKGSPDSAGAYLMRLDPRGNVLWQRVVDRYRAGFSVIQTADCGYVMSELIPAADSGVGLIRTDSFGNLLWRKRYNMPYGIWSDYIPMRQTTDGGYIIGAKTLIKVDSAGVLQWTKTYEGTFAAYSVVQTPDHGYAATGFLQPDSNGRGDMCLLKTDSVGNLEWTQTYGYGGIGYWVEQGARGGIVAVGAPSHWDVGGLVLGMDDFGNPIWRVPLRSSAQCIARTKDGGFIITGCARGQLVLTKLAPERKR
jgi:hypothetical protein